MAFTYDLTDLDAPIAQIRSRIGDTSKQDVLLEDEEITQVLSEHASSIPSASLECAYRALAKLFRDVDRSNLGMSATRSQQIANLKDLIGVLEQNLAKSGAAPFVGGVSRSRRDALREEQDFTQAIFERGHHNIHGTRSGTDPDGCG